MVPPALGKPRRAGPAIRGLRPCPCSHRVSVLVLRRGAAAGGATFDMVCPQPPAEKKDQGSNNVKNGTSGERALARLQASPFGLRPDKSARRRATPLGTTHSPPFVGSRRFRTSGRVFLPAHRRDDRTVCPSSLQSEKRTQRPNLGAIAESPFHSDSAGPCSFLERPRSARRLRRPWHCRYGPLLRPAIRGHLAR